MYSGFESLSRCVTCKYFPFVGCLSTLLTLSLAGQKLLILIKSNFSFFLLLIEFSVSNLRNHGLTQSHKDLLLCFLLRAL